MLFAAQRGPAGTPAGWTPAGNYGDAVTDYVNAVYSGKLPADAYPLASGRITRVNDPYQGAEFTSTLTFTDGGVPASS